ncbi:hypothetical protein BJX61DRAFT_550019 [Aspergillus egyptiacus]|nr:hypothetical protein BJX61DRAFT_550019 [Aspergillus egyptiacus]
MSYEVFTAEYIGQPNHIALYIETNPSPDDQDRSGRLYHVIGTILQGMKYASPRVKDPAFSTSFVRGTKKMIGTIAASDLERFETECCKAVAPPALQMTVTGQPLDPSRPLYRCNQWLDDVVKLAFEKGIFQNEGGEG